MAEPKHPIKNALRLPLILFAAGALVVIFSSIVGLSDRTTGNIFRAIGSLLLLAGLIGTCFPLKRSQRYTVYYKHSPGQVTGTLLVNAIIFGFNGRDLDEQIHSFLSKWVLSRTDIVQFKSTLADLEAELPREIVLSPFEALDARILSVDFYDVPSPKNLTDAVILGE